MTSWWYGRRRRVVAIAIAPALLVGGLAALAADTELSAQNPRPTPPRDNSARASGTAEIRGRVVSAETGEPLPGARVESSTVQFTDGGGRFVLSGLPPGEYVITASKGGYLSTRFGQRPGARADQVNRIEVAAGQIVEGVELALVKGGVVTGQVIDERGANVVGVQVILYRQIWEAGQPVARGAAGVGADQTDDRGEFRLFGVPAGTYLLAVVPTSARGQQATAFYPGAYGADQAQPVRVQAGQVVSGLTVELGLTSMVTLSGTVTRADGKMPIPDGSWGVVATPAGPRVDGRAAEAVVTRDGRYQFSPLPVGEYTLRVEVSRPERLFALANVFLDGTAANVPLVLEQGYSVRGRYVLEGDGPEVLRANDGLWPFTPLDSSSIGAPWVGRPDGFFEVSGLKGRFWVNWPAPSGLTVERVMALGEDITDKLLDLTAGDKDGVTVVVSQRSHANLTGHVAADNGQAPLNVTVLLFPEDQAKVFPSSPFVRAAFMDASGRFTIRGVLPGRYIVVAVEDLMRGEESNPRLMAVLRSNAIGVDVKRGESQSLILQRFRPPAEYLGQ